MTCVIQQIPVEQTLSLRREVLWPDMPLEKVKLPEDSDGWHFGAFLQDVEEPVAVISLFRDALGPVPAVPEPGDSATGSTTARFRKFACKISHQGRGIGTALLDYTLKFARTELGAQTVWCDARTSTSEWYEKRGLFALWRYILQGSRGVPPYEDRFQHF
ncbi:hypothetical protein D9758_018249 [Tetrapyrgos nigripes]|uniref:N-acetyltransferase domain-containing protein n=1 Tax=Tetrapyrgos nigripes TaxID=182062 RepID=A0A8H5C4D4_9AGAR|nr:hypothetical protein D9758_018249 [Tetrapyrgos nigripes]